MPTNRSRSTSGSSRSTTPRRTTRKKAEPVESIPEQDDVALGFDYEESADADFGDEEPAEEEAVAEEAPKKRRAPAKAKAAAPKKRRSTKAAEAEAEEAPAPRGKAAPVEADDDFGAGVDVPEPTPAPSPMRAAASKPAPPVVVKENTYASYGRDDDDEADEFEDGDFEDEGETAQGSGEGGEEGDPGRKKKRRRRRRKKKGAAGEGAPEGGAAPAAPAPRSEGPMDRGPGGGGGGGGMPQRNFRDRGNFQQGGGGGGYQGRYDRGPQGGGGGRYQQDRGPGGPGGNRYNDRPQQQQYGARRPPNRGGMPTAKYQRNAPPVDMGAVQTGTLEGVLELHPKGYGFLRDASNDFGARETDAFVSSSFVERHHLREGILLKGEVGPGSRGQGPRLLSIESIDGKPVEDYEALKHFDTLTAINPFELIKLESGSTPISMRVMDLLCPIGKGQRALIVAPPRSGKTMLLQDIANSVSKNHPEIHLIVLLIDERPEEVTEMKKTVRGEIIASSMDRDIESHVRISQLIVERGKRIAESGKDCFILLDSITRTARAFNKWVGGGRDAKIQTGGLDVRAMEIPRKMFGTARRFEEGGSLTVCGTCLVDTGSKMDDAIFQEFKGTGNMEMVLSRDLADRRIWPAIDITKSGTRREEKLLSPEVYDGVTMLRRSLINMNPVEAMEQLSRTLAKFPSNKEFLERLKNIL
ncbi:transcription termination factor Rho [Planctomyces sp. SH-PL14]|uniref:transcription termination factor Rho n=1 Tax=Planctomyces sp. SH-PL14 TaxID=1632864 RepID=UPI00078D65BD|nr:transcription termination factor Rho [Planctomyces sp. SH-PL14]AMV18852.1 hypothetical protein VT03_13260 [Planctomyces sp. SH-PL14]